MWAEKKREGEVQSFSNSGFIRVTVAYRFTKVHLVVVTAIKNKSDGDPDLELGSERYTLRRMKACLIPGLSKTSCRIESSFELLCHIRWTVEHGWNTVPDLSHSIPPLSQVSLRWSVLLLRVPCRNNEYCIPLPKREQPS